MWTANLIAKTERTDGGLDLIVDFSDGTSKFQKTFVVFGDFDISEIVRQEIARLKALHNKSQMVELGNIVPAIEKEPSTPDQIFTDILKLRKLKSAQVLNLVDDSAVSNQANIVKQNPNFLDFI